jgi:hypothetical protein
MSAAIWRRTFSYGLILAFGCGFALYLGKDANWDSFNYHLYAGFSAIENRFGLDYFAASTQAT